MLLLPKNMDVMSKRMYIPLLFLIIIIEVTGSDSNETSINVHRESRGAGRIVKLYSGPRPEPILCTNEGFQKDPYNCALFYRCVKSGNGKYTVYRFQCGPGTVYDPDTEVCNHPRSTKRSECGGYLPPVEDTTHINEIESMNNEVPSPIVTNKPIYVATDHSTKTSTIITEKLPVTSEATYFTNLNNSYAWGSTISHVHPESSVTTQPLQSTSQHQIFMPSTTSNTQQSIPHNNICTADGFMGDSENCRKFYRCVANDRGGYTRFEFTCSENTIWDEEHQICNHDWAVKRTQCVRLNDINNGNYDNSLNEQQYDTDKEIKPNQDEYNNIEQQSQVNYGSKVPQIETQTHKASIQNQTEFQYGNQINEAKYNERNHTVINHSPTYSQTQPTQIYFGNSGNQTQSQNENTKEDRHTPGQIIESSTPSITTANIVREDHKRDLCSDVGFMRDPDNCQKFYRCVNNGNGGFNKIEFTCADGTVWDQSILACNHAWAVKECGAKFSSDSVHTTTTTTHKVTQNHYITTSTESYIGITEPADTNYDDGYMLQNPVSTIPSSTTTTTMSSQINVTKEGKCTTSGFMGDDNDCKIFYRCVENSAGGFTKHVFKCGEGTLWDPQIEACNHAWAVSKCGGDASLDISKSETATDKLSTSTSIHVQSTTINPIPSEIGQEDNEHMDPGYGISKEDSSIITTSTKTPQPVIQDNLSCKTNGFIGDRYDCRKFYRCVEDGKGSFIRYEFTCSAGTVWNERINTCDHASAVDSCGNTTTKSNIQNQTNGSLTENINQITTIIPTIIAIATTEHLSIEDNKCTHNGFMGDSKYCNKFYKCVENKDGSYTKYEFVCGEGTQWNQETKACTRDSSIDKCNSTFELPNETYETTSHHLASEAEFDTGYPLNDNADSNISISNQTIGFTIKPNDGAACSGEGFMGDKNNCMKFYRCVNDGIGGFIRYEFACGQGTVWDQSIQACNHAWDVKDCSATGENLTNISTSSSTSTSTSTSTSISTSTMAMVTVMLPDQGYPYTTEDISNVYDSENKSDVMCAKEGFIGDTNNCKKFYRCVNDGKGVFTKYDFTCGEGTYWSQEILACDHITSDKECDERVSSSTTKLPPQEDLYTEINTIKGENHLTQKPPVTAEACTSEGFYGNKNDCKKFYRCVDNGNGGYIKYDFTCGDGTNWDQVTQACDHELEGKCTSSVTQSSSETPGATSIATTETDYSPSSTNSNQCTSEGYFADSNDCEKFIKCVKNKNNGYTKHEFACPNGTVWVQKMLTCYENDGEACNTHSITNPTLPENRPLTTETYVTSTSRVPHNEDLDQKPPSLSTDDTCTSEGFYGNKNNCREFYRCVDNGQGGYTKYDFTCSDGTAWDSRLQSCNHIDQVENCQGSVVQDEINTQTTRDSTTVSQYPSTTQTQKTSTTSKPSFETTSGGSTTSQYSSTKPTQTTTTTAQPNLESTSQYSTSANSNDTCNNEGYFGDSQDCKKFYRCVDNGQGGYTKYNFDCAEGTIWDQNVIICNHPENVLNPSCNRTQTSTTEQNSSSDNSSSGSSSSGSSSTGSSSSPSPSITSSSSNTTESNSSTQSQDNDDNSKNPDDFKVNCTKAGFYANPNDCQKFYRCVDWDGNGTRFSVYHFECGEGTIWDPAVETCNHEESVYPPRDCSGSQSQSENQSSTTENITTQEETTIESTSQSTTQSTAPLATDATTQSTTELTTESTTQLTTEATTQSTTGSTTQSATESTTQSTAVITSQPTTQSTTQSTTEPTTQSTTEATTGSTTESTTQSSTQSTPQSTTALTTSDSTEQIITSTLAMTSTTTEKSGETTTNKLEETTTERFQESTTENSGETTTTRPGESTTGKQEETTTAKPEESTTAKPEQSTTEKLEETTTAKLEASTTTEKTEGSTTGKSTESTTEQTGENTTEISSNSTTQESSTEPATTAQTTEENTTSETSTDNNSTEKECPDTEEDQYLFVCPSSFRRHPKYCNLFYQCDENEDTHEVKVATFTCPNNTIYDETQIKCVEENKANKKCEREIAQKRRVKRKGSIDENNPIEVSKDSFFCPFKGYYMFEKDSECSPGFLKCVKTKYNKLRGFVYQCPTGYIFWSVSRRCEPINRVSDCKRSFANDWSKRWEIPIESKNVDWS